MANELQLGDLSSSGTCYYSLIVDRTDIELDTYINADVKKCFDLSRSIDLHLRSSEDSKERVIGGRSTGLIELGEFVEWEAVHFGFRLRMKVKIVLMESPSRFSDEMIKGPFVSMRHVHEFSSTGKITHMKDRFTYEVPFGIFGKIFNRLVLKSYMINFLAKRNRLIKKLAEQPDPYVQ